LINNYDENLKIYIRTPHGPHRAVQNYLHAAFPGHCICREGIITWPPHPPDITPPHYFFWGYVKDTVYQQKVSSLQELQQITTAVGTADARILDQTCTHLSILLMLSR
jgi:hypothetical protein